MAFATDLKQNEAVAFATDLKQNEAVTFATDLKQNEAQSARAESRHKGVNYSARNTQYKYNSKDLSRL